MTHERGSSSSAPKTTVDPAAYLGIALAAFTKAEYHRAAAAALIGLLGHVVRQEPRHDG